MDSSFSVSDFVDEGDFSSTSSPSSSVQSAKDISPVTSASASAGSGHLQALVAFNKMEAEREAKLVVIGSSGVGKTAFIQTMFIGGGDLPIELVEVDASGEHGVTAVGEKLDAFIVLLKEKYTAADSRLLSHLRTQVSFTELVNSAVTHRQDKPFFIVVNKFDLILKNKRADYHDTRPDEAIMEETRSTYARSINMPVKRIFIVSSLPENAQNFQAMDLFRVRWPAMSSC